MVHTPNVLLKQFQRPLLLGMGGGYDIFAGLPTYFDFVAHGKTPVLANLSFTRELDKKYSSKIDDLQGCVSVFASDFEEGAFAESLGFPKNYFPEYHLSNWFNSTLDSSTPVHAIQLIREPTASTQLGVESYFDSLTTIVSTNQCDAIILIDAGVDSVLIGDEEGLGTYAEDFLTLLASTKTELPIFLQCVGLGTEAGIAVDDFLVNLSVHRKNEAYIGCFDWIQSEKGVGLYLDAVANCIPVNSSIQSLLTAAIRGKYGTTCPESLKKRGLNDGDILVHPLMTLAFWFDARRVMYGRMFVKECSEALSLFDLDLRFDEARRHVGLIDAQGIYRGQRPFSRDFDNLLLDRFTRGSEPLDP